ncbi:histidine kinase [Nocardioides sp.]|uniref:sensor histidine kinase n=1 Tax=Nocardioides sp. TaxID=35761 RepID=UPI00286DFB5F|nr:histidine kinase [Nocardioides sp.]
MIIRVHHRQLTHTPRSVVQSALARFALLSFATLVLLGITTALVSRHIARDEAIRDARSRSEAIAHSVAAPLVNAAVRSRDPEAMRALNEAMEARLRYGSVSHIVLWDAQGRVLWADDKQAVGKLFALTDKLEDLVLSGGSLLVEPGERPEHPGREEGERELLEVYVAGLDEDSVPFLFEAYVSPERLDQDYQAIFRELLPVSLGMLLLLEFATLPLAISLARRIDRVNGHRSTILERSLRSWHEERRGLAQELHDGVIQDFSAISYALPAVIDRLPGDASADAARDVGRRINALLEKSLVALRSIVVDLAPAELDGPGLVAALESLRSQAAHVGLEVSVQVDPDLELGETVGGLVYRVVREGLRNVEKHAEARSVVVEVSRRGELVEVLVTDDGRGVVSEVAEEGHVGLRLLGQFVRDLGGTLHLGEGPTGGAELCVTIPVALPGLSDDPG